MSDFLSFHTLIDDIFVKDYCRTAQARVVISGMQVDNDEMYCEIPNQPSHAYPSLYLSNFLPFHISNNNFFFVKDCFKTVPVRVVIFDKQIDNDVLYRGIANQPSHAYSCWYLAEFLSIF